MLKRLIGFLGGAKVWLIVIGVLVATNAATGWIAKHALQKQGALRAELSQAEASNKALREQAERAEAAALIAQQAQRQAETERAKAHKRLADLERSKPDVKAWSDAPVPADVLACLRDENCGE